MSYQLACTFKREIDSAVLVTDTDTGEDIWFPLSHVDKMVRDKNQRGTITVTDWIAEQKGLS